MIIYFLGQPCSGKTTLADYFYEHYYSSEHGKSFRIDGDKMRDLFKNTDYSREGRITNLNRSSDVATYLHSEGHDVIMSFVCPYKEAREYLEEKGIPILWIHLDYEKSWDVRGRESYHVEDFDALSTYPLKNTIQINTTQMDVKDCYDEIKKRVDELKKKTITSLEDAMIQIRYNTNYPNHSNKKWRMLINGTQHLVDDVVINRQCQTTTDIVIGDDGAQVEKHHISCEGSLEIEELNGKLLAKIK